jgi:carboxyl-terminal processing protease
MAISSWSQALRALCLLLLAMVAGTVHADPLADISRLIQQLGSKDFREREAASQQLDRIGEPAIKFLRKAADEHADPEVRQRAQVLVESIQNRAYLSEQFAQRILGLIDAAREAHVLEFDKGELAAVAIRSLYAKVHEKIPAYVHKRIAKLKGADDKEISRALIQARADLIRPGQLADRKDFIAAAKAVTAHLDPYSDIIEVSPIRICQRGPDPENNALGAQFAIDPVTRCVRIVAPYLDGPAHRAGLRAGDAITHIILSQDRFGEKLDPPDVISTRDLSLREVAWKLSGQKNSRLDLRVVDGKNHPQIFSIKRTPFQKESVFGIRRMKDDRWDYLVDRKSRIAYLQIPAFSDGTSKQLEAQIKELKKAGLKGLVLDLRFNAGGLLREAVNTADLFIDAGSIVRVTPRAGRSEEWSARQKGSQLDFPMACLVNGESARAAEIVAACLQDHKRAVIVGERTQGNGCIQNIFGFEVVGEWNLKVTTALFYRPNGKKLDRLKVPWRDEDEWGVIPDKGQTIRLTDDERAALRDHLRQREIISRPGSGQELAFEDRQLEQAIKSVRSRIATP